ncbi:hypothetical protein QQP08_011079 [Theobroma cacao]|nr:hypothetical protein QQP08_011079 [Theobroma cacao]
MHFSEASLAATMFCVLRTIYWFLSLTRLVYGIWHLLLWNVKKCGRLIVSPGPFGGFVDIAGGCDHYDWLQLVIKEEC